MTYKDSKILYYLFLLMKHMFFRFVLDAMTRHPFIILHFSFILRGLYLYRSDLSGDLSMYLELKRYVSLVAIIVFSILQYTVI